MTTRIVEGKKPYTGGTAIEIDENKVISLRLRDENNLIIYDEGDDEIYVDLQLDDEIKPTSAFPIGVNVGRVIVDNGWDKPGTIISAETTSGDNIKIFYADEGTLWIDNGTGTFKQIYFKADVDALLLALRNYIDGELAKKQNGVASATAPENPSEGDLWYDTTNSAMKVWDGTAWQSVGTGGGGSDIEYVTQAEYNALLPGALTDNKHYFIYTESGPTPSVISCDFTQGDQGFSITEAHSTNNGRDSNGFYIKSAESWGAGARLLIPSTITSVGTPKMIKLYGKNMDVGSGIGISEGIDSKFIRVFNVEINCNPYSGTGAWGTPNNTSVSSLNEDVFVIDFENGICYLESSPNITATIYPSTILTLWNNSTLNLCFLSPNNSNYGYLQKAEFYF